MFTRRSTSDTVHTVSPLPSQISTMLTPAEDLQALCLIPRSPSPIPLEDRPEESLNREELLELLRRQKVSTTVPDIQEPRLTLTGSPRKSDRNQARAQERAC
jgi:hypothetical protein